jgi:two-component system NtrC family sensor kinase
VTARFPEVQSPQSAVSTASPRTILIVDDDVGNLKLLKTFLGVDGYQVLLAESGEEGLDTLRKNEVDLVILDVRMPGMDGIEVCRRIRGDPSNARLPVIFLTADDANEQRMFQGLEVGGDEFLHKPIHRRALSARVKNLLRLADAERERKLVTAVAQHEKLAAIGQVAAGVAHEINNPLAFVLANLECLRGYFGDLRDVIEAYRRSPGDGRAVEAKVGLDALLRDVTPLLDETVEGGKRVRSIVKELKTFSRADSDQLEAVDLVDVVKSTLLLTEREVANHAEVKKSLEPAPIDHASRAKLHQVMLNLIVNAMHAVGSRPLRPPERHLIRVQTRSADDAAILEVSDSGCGIAAEHLSHLFEPFFTTKPLGVGTGLGLSVCATIVQRLGGRIDVESTVGVGTTFRVVIPRHAPSTSTAGDTSAAPDAPTRARSAAEARAEATATALPLAEHARA